MAIVEEITAERQRQVLVEGWSAEHDDEHKLGELAEAAACYASPSPIMHNPGGLGRVPVSWPWDYHWWKPKGRRRDLIRAAALIVAEIERLDRRAAINQPGGDVDAVEGKRKPDGQKDGVDWV